MSFYIPYVNMWVTERVISNQMDVWGIGSVKRVDFVPCEKGGNQAFVYFNRFYMDEECDRNMCNLDILKDKEDDYVPNWWEQEWGNILTTRLLRRLDSGKSYRLVINPCDEKEEHWLLLKNKSIDPEKRKETGLARKVQLLEEEVTTLKDQILRLQEENQSQSKQIQ